MAYSIEDAIIGAQPIDETSTEQNHPLGFIVQASDPALGSGEFIYLEGAASTIVGSVCVVQSSYNAALATTASRGQLAVSMSANLNGQYGWYQISGTAQAKYTGTLVANALLYATATAGSISSTSATGALIVGAIAATAESTDPLANLMLTRPTMQGLGA